MRHQGSKWLYLWLFQNNFKQPAAQNRNEKDKNVEQQNQLFIVCRILLPQA